MTHRASEVVRLLESLRTPSSAVSSSTATSSTLTGGEFLVPVYWRLELSGAGAGPSSASMDVDTRAPKRPWEETQTQPHGTHSGSFPSAPTANMSGPASGAERTAAEKDMELIRTKRAMTANLAAAAAAANGGTPGGGSGGGVMGGATSMGGGGGSSKNKYRKRSVRCPLFLFCLKQGLTRGRILWQRATPPGKCHSCNIRETPEWRRGPDGARTLCNACGLRECLCSFCHPYHLFPVALLPLAPTNLVYIRLCQTCSETR